MTFIEFLAAVATELAKDGEFIESEDMPRLRLAHIIKWTPAQAAAGLMESRNEQSV